MAQSFIGKPISLISHSDVRYRGILAGIDPAASTIQLSNVYSMGTESRRPPSEFIPPVQEPYQYIIFRASEVKDLAVDEPTPRRSVHDDPAVLAVPPPGPARTSPYPAPAVVQQPLPQQQPPPQAYPVNGGVTPQHPPSPNTQAAAAAARAGRRGGNSVHTAAASLETVERALGDLRVSNTNATTTTTTVNGSGRAGGGGGRRAGGRARAADAQTQAQLKVPTTDFDFASANAKFDKAALGTPKTEVKSEAGEEGEDKDKEGGAVKEGKEKESAPGAGPAYNPQKSFFDSLSSGAQSGPSGAATGGGGGRGRRGGRGAGGRNRREEERERNVATFGEPGGVGLMGPGAYVGGWGGYGRRGGRPRRGGGAPVQARG
ncbi:putative scd6-like Sm domain containing protein [Lyophyllum shimeji]|uniref:Scd6-like Sm domain containing protein n=1 Tax=Lyophyllum shimeji TaxID=47721 RepID=A0A9P3PFD7_LYOSH|nr:putative scd6-like Sm domain containing protein [Lyophyllum shimeji]